MINQYHIATIPHMWYWINRCCFSSKGIAIITIRPSHDHLILIIHIPILGKIVFILEQHPGSAEKTLSGLFSYQWSSRYGKRWSLYWNRPQVLQRKPYQGCSPISGPAGMGRGMGSATSNYKAWPESPRQQADNPTERTAHYTLDTGATWQKCFMSSWVKSSIIMTQSGHKFAHVTTAQLSWHVQNCDLIQLFFTD